MFFSLPVLMYHSISRFKHKLCVAPELFDEHCRTLSQAGWRGISLAETQDYYIKKRTLPRKTCLLTFDDGYLDNYVYAEPILRANGHCGVLFPVAHLLAPDATPLRPNREALATAPAEAKKLPNLDVRQTVQRNRLPVYKIDFCSWNEVRHMHQGGVMAAAPHSLQHQRVVRSLAYSKLYVPKWRHGFFGGPPYDIVWGMPQFDLGHALAERGYTIAPELFETVKRMVPQEPEQAKIFLAQEKNQQAVQAALNALPCLGVLETKAAYRARLAEEFAACHAIFTKQLGEPPLSFCWPWGSYSRVALQQARNVGFRVFFATGRGVNLPFLGGCVHRIAVRGGTVEQLLATVTQAANAFAELPYTLAGFGKQLRDKYMRWGFM